MRGSASSTLVSIVLLAAPALASVEGTWGRREPASPDRVVIGPGGATSIVVDFAGTPVTFTGTVTSPQPFSITASAGGCQATLAGRTLANEQLIDASAQLLCFSGGFTFTDARVILERCGCDDGNADPGDGCDAACQVEPCWSCSGAPSTCTPSGDGAACDDRHDCTTGATCTAGACGGGTSVPACVDMTGRWTVQEYHTLAETTELVDYDVTQRNGILEIREVGSPFAGRIGSIDVGTGAFETGTPMRAGFCPAGARVRYHGGSDGVSFDGHADMPHIAMAQCTLLSDVYVLDGARVDGCTEGAACDDGNDCTSGDLCTNHVCAGTIVANGAACSDGNACTAGDRCLGGGCVPLTGVACGGTCHGCDPDTGCFVRPDGAACSDFDACSSGDACLAGTCVPSNPTCGTCERCSAGGLGCVADVRTDCEQAAGSRSSLLGRNLASTATGPPQLTWKWKGGDGVALADLGDPTASTDYQLCVFEDADASPTVLFGAGAPAASCGAEPCWKPLSTRGFQFRNRTGAGDGLTSVVVKTGAAGKAAVVLKGKGDGLTERPLGVPGPPFDLPLRVQLRAEGGACFEARIDAAGTSRNGDGQFKGKTTAP